MKKTALKFESTPEATEQQKKAHKIPYEKPELRELGSVGDMTSDVVGSLNAI